MAKTFFLDKKKIKVVAANGDEYIIVFDSQMNYLINERYNNVVLDYITQLFDELYDGKTETVMSFSVMFIRRKFDPFLMIYSGRDIERIRIGAKIREMRISKNIDAKSLAERIGIDPSNLCKIEQGRYSVGFDVLSKIAQALNCKVDLVEI